MTNFLFRLKLLHFCCYVSFFICCRLSMHSALQLQIQDNYVTIDNDVMRLTLSKPEGNVMEIQYNGVDNVLEVRNQVDNTGYWDLNWREPQSREMYYRITGTDFTVIKEDEEQVELSFTTTWNPSLEGKVCPLNIDKRFIMLRGCSGFYTYAIYEHLEGWPDFDLTQTRAVFKLRKDIFHYMAISDDRQRTMPMPEDRIAGLPLSYPEAVLLTNPTNSNLTGEVDDKYQYSCENQHNRVHGWISSDPAIGFWIITPSDEFRTGGPVKQDLTSHVGPISLAMFVSRHYAGEEVDLKFRNGEGWKKVFGPVLIYLNSISDAEELYAAHWEDAKQQMMAEVQKWPYDFPVSDEFLCSDQRGTVRGRLLVQISEEDYASADSAYIGLAPPGEIGSWQREGKGYQFWTIADSEGSFCTSNILPGEYNLFAWIPGFIGDYRYSSNLMIEPGSDIDLGDLVYEPSRDGSIIWEIGIPDRSAQEFYIPEPNPKFNNRLFAGNHLNCSSSVEKYRQYGLWERYTELYPDRDLIYTVGTSEYTKDWFFAQFTRFKEDGTFQATTWQIKFTLDKLDEPGTYKVRLALASATNAELQVRFNDENVFPPHFTTGLIGKDNAMARHGIHGLYWMYDINVSSGMLVRGINTIFLTQSKSSGPFQGIMYDYIRLENPLFSLNSRTHLG
ncbi:hypothetical protein MKW92_001815 [Papaver armeniacum]|nr:hypothetical protein MKW92_001815 [Papaver armeniacum]